MRGGLRETWTMADLGTCGATKRAPTRNSPPKVSTRPESTRQTEKVPQLPSKAPFSKRFEDAVGLACESAAVRRVARQFGLVSSTVLAIDLRYLKRWAAGRTKPALRQMGVDEI